MILRETVVVGLVGAAGPGQPADGGPQFLRHDQLIALVVVYVLLTLMGEDGSDRARQRLLAA